jgi:hypothetical protein
MGVRSRYWFADVIDRAHTHHLDGRVPEQSPK